jgi:hypothetical protein
MKFSVARDPGVELRYAWSNRAVDVQGFVPVPTREEIPEALQDAEIVGGFCILPGPRARLQRALEECFRRG